MDGKIFSSKRGIRALFLGAVCACLFSSCAAVSVATREAVDRKISSCPVGSPVEVVQAKMGIPQSVVMFANGQDRIEVWGYQMGNYTYSEWGVLLFRNGKLVATPRNHIEMFKYLRMIRVIEDAQFVEPLEQARLQAKKIYGNS